VALVGERTIPTERPPLVGVVSANFLRIECVAWSAQRIPTVVNLGFLDRSRYFFLQVAPQFSSRGWVDPIPDPLLLRKSGRSGNRTRDLWICSQKLLFPLFRLHYTSIYPSLKTLTEKVGRFLVWILFMTKTNVTGGIWCFSSDPPGKYRYSTFD
jgi:hypothetical protein